MNKQERDYQLDMYRGLAMIYVVCFIHVLYWLGLGGQPLMSVALFEMPVIFFISGASLSFNRNPRPILNTLKNRFFRILLPYYIYAAIMIIVVALLSLVCFLWYSNIECATKTHMFDITQYTLYDIKQILMTSDIPQIPFVWHLWFIIPYLILSCTFDIQKKLLGKTNSGGYLCLCIILFIITNLLSVNDLFKTVLFYNIFMVMGFCYYKNCKSKLMFMVAVASFIIVIFINTISDKKFCPMQEHKFPPDILFLAYNIFVICILSLILKRIRIPQWRILKIWNERGYTIYLYQNIIIYTIHVAHHVLIKSVPNNITQFVICSILVFILSTLMSSVTYKLEIKIIKTIKKTFSIAKFYHKNII